MRAGTFPRARVVGGRSMWRSDEVDAWMAALPVRPLKGDAEVSVASSAKPRLIHLARCIHALGEGPLFYLICEMSSSPAALAMFEAYAALDGDFIRAYGGDRPPPTICRVK
jgi:hypothetical protein